jgi:hypothetical protein
MPNRSSLVEIIGLSLLSLLLYKLGVFFLLFLIPLHILRIRRGYAVFLYSCGGVLLLIFLFGLLSTRTIEEPGLHSVLLLLEVITPALLMAGLLLIDAEVPYLQRRLYRILAVTGGAGLLSIPVVVAMTSNETYVGFIKDQIDLFITTFREAMQQSAQSGTVFMEGFLTTDRVYDFFKAVALRNYVFFYFLIVSGNWKAGEIIGRKSIGETVEPITSFSLPDVLIWPLLFSWTGVLLNSLVSVGPFVYLFWNTGLIFLFLFGIQGFAIIRFLLEKYKVDRRARLLIGLGVVIFLFIPGINFLIIIGVPGLGVSELWIKYRKEERSE